VLERRSRSSLEVRPPGGDGALATRRCHGRRAVGNEHRSHSCFEVRQHVGDGPLAARRRHRRRADGPQRKSRYVACRGGWLEAGRPRRADGSTSVTRGEPLGPVRAERSLFDQASSFPIQMGVARVIFARLARWFDAGRRHVWGRLPNHA
jgi:hypothetical protein